MKEEQKVLFPTFEFRKWSDLSAKERDDVWKYCKQTINLVDKLKADSNKKGYGDPETYDYPIYKTIVELNENHKTNSPTKDLMRDSIGRRKDKYPADPLFKQVFLELDEVWVVRMLSIFANNLIFDGNLRKKEGEFDKDYFQRNSTWKYQHLDLFKNRLNQVLEDFGLDLKLTRIGFVFRQEKKILEKIYNPTLEILADPKFEVVNRELKDAFDGLSSGDKKGYSSCIGHSITGIEAFLSIIQDVEIGVKSLSDLITGATKKEMIPSDPFSKTLFKDWKSILMQERQTKGHAHVKKEYATQENAQTILNLSMIFIQHCLNYQE